MRRESVVCIELDSQNPGLGLKGDNPVEKNRTEDASHISFFYDAHLRMDIVFACVGREKGDG